MELKITLTAEQLTEEFGVPTDVAAEWLSRPKIIAHRVAFNSDVVEIDGNHFQLTLGQHVQDMAVVVNAEPLPWL